MTSRRYYLHGDQKEGAPDLFFCVLCDAFIPEGHFRVDHPKTNHYERYLRSLHREAQRKRNGTSFLRPKDAPNCLE